LDIGAYLHFKLAALQRSVNPVALL